MKNDVFWSMGQAIIFRGQFKVSEAQGCKQGIYSGNDRTNAPFWTCRPSGNQVDGLPLALSKDAATASCRSAGRATKHTIEQKNMMIDDTYQGKLLVNLCFLSRDV